MVNWLANNEGTLAYIDAADVVVYTCNCRSDCKYLPYYIAAWSHFVNQQEAQNILRRNMLKYEERKIE